MPTLPDDSPPPDPSPDEVTRLLRRLAQGDAAAEQSLFALIYDQLRRLARSFLRRERPGHSLQATALVNEAYLRMMGNYKIDWQSRAQFFGMAASIMRRILIDHARNRRAEKRGGGNPPVTFDEGLMATEDNLDTLVDIDDALNRLAEQDPRQAKIVEMRFFGGLTEEEIALLLGLSERTIKREWVVAKAWLSAELGGARPEDPSSHSG